MKRYAYVDMDKKLITIIKNVDSFSDDNYIKIKNITYKKNSILINGKIFKVDTIKEVFCNMEAINKRLTILTDNYYEVSCSYHEYQENISDSFFKTKIATFYETTFYITKSLNFKRKFTNFSVVEEITK